MADNKPNNNSPIIELVYPFKWLFLGFLCGHFNPAGQCGDVTTATLLGVAMKGDPTFAPATVAPAMISWAPNRVRVMIGFLV